MTDLAVVAGRLTRAADFIQERAALLPEVRWESFCPGSEGFDVRETAPTGRRRGRRRLARVSFGEWAEDRAAAELMAFADPAALAALVPLMRLAAKGCRMELSPLSANERAMVDYLAAFAARLLREETDDD